MLQIIGRNKDKNTRSAVRWVKERRIEFQFVDLDERKLSPKEWSSIFNSVGSEEELIDEDSIFYKKNGYMWREYNAKEEVMEHIELLRIPVLRIGQKAHVGWKEQWLKENL